MPDYAYKLGTYFGVSFISPLCVCFYRYANHPKFALPPSSFERGSC
jgi:hypothetical protein